MKRMIVSLEAQMKTNGGSTPNHDAFHQDEEKKDSPTHLARIRHTESRQHFSCLADRVAVNFVGCQLNYRIPHAEMHYPIDIESRFVSKYFPNAIGGPLYVDEPKTQAQMIKAYEKQKLLKKLGFRSVVIEISSEYEELDTAFADCMDQLGET